MLLDAKTRFLAKVEKRPDGCWIWVASVQQATGYGRFGISSRNVTYAHRASWMLFRGDIPDGLYVCHKCDVRTCVNPDHLFLGTAKDNMRDASRKGRVCIPEASYASSELHQPAKLTNDQVLEIRASSATLMTFADRFGVSEAAVSKARRRLTFREVA